MDPLEPYAKQGLTWERAMAHAKQLALRAADLVAQDPAYHPVGVILTPDAGELREIVRQGPPPPGDWVPLLLRREDALRLLRANAPASQEWLVPDTDGATRQLPVIVITPFGFRLGSAPYEVPARPRGRIPYSVHAMVICSQAFQQAGTGKWCMIGTHDKARVPGFPWMHQFALFLSIGDFTSGSKLEIRVRLDDEVLCRVEAEAGLGEAVGTLDVGMTFPPLKLPRAGAYEVEMLAAGKLLAARTLTVDAPEP